MIPYQKDDRFNKDGNKRTSVIRYLQNHEIATSVRSMGKTLMQESSPFGILTLGCSSCQTRRVFCPFQHTNEASPPHTEHPEWMQEPLSCYLRHSYTVLWPTSFKLCRGAGYTWIVVVIIIDQWSGRRCLLFEGALATAFSHDFCLVLGLLQLQ